MKTILCVWPALIAAFLVNFNMASSQTFGLGTRWVYEYQSPVFPFERRPVTYEITGQTLWHDTLVYVIEPGVFSSQEYMYVHGDSIYFWDLAANRFQLNYDFSAMPGESYESDWVGLCDGSISGVAHTTVESVSEVSINGNMHEIQSVWIANNGSFTEDVTYHIYSGIGSDEGLTLYLGDGLCDFFRMTKLRCFEGGDNSYNFVGYPCDANIIVSDEEALATEGVRIFPNPGTGEFFIRQGQLPSQFPFQLYDLSGKIIQRGITLDGSFEIKQPGMYILVLEQDGRRSAHKVVVLDR